MVGWLILFIHIIGDNRVPGADKSDFVIFRQLFSSVIYIFSIWRSSAKINISSTVIQYEVMYSILDSFQVVRCRSNCTEGYILLLTCNPH